ncbi:polynucleotide kinase-phosphatase [Chungangia koreensis]|uniref:Polynucleotide kinase-phosphatase n=1 Tax=Chungangia koreensis TaxID=752657 RepID=A0ABV8X4B0_9LACT
MKIQFPHAGIVILVGPSNSGKTTYLQQWIDQGILLRTEIVSSDEFRLAVGDTDFISWTNRPKDEADALFEEYQTISGEAFRMMEEVIKARCRLNKLTVVDATHLFAEDRKRYVALSKQFHVPITAIVLDIRDETLFHRDQIRDQPRGMKRVRQQIHHFKKGLRSINGEGFHSVYRIGENEELEISRRINPLYIDVGNGIDFIGDIHGCFDELINLLTKLGYEEKAGFYIHPEGRRFMSVGDVMSRGPESLKTMLFFKKHIENGLAFMTDSNHGWKIARWLEGRNVTLNHGDECVEAEIGEYERQYGQEEANQLKAELKSFLWEAPSHYVITKNGVPTVVCTHAGIKDEWIGKESEQISDFCRYGDTDGVDETNRPIRKDWTVHHKGSLLIVWGHDPKPQPQFINRTLNIDQGVVFGGRLTAFRYPDGEIMSVQAKINYSGYEDHPLAEWKRKRFNLPNIAHFLNGYTVNTQDLGDVKIPSNQVKSAIDSVSRNTLPIEKLFYIPPTMSPTPEPSALNDYLEHPQEAINYYRNHGVTKLIAEKKHMGSRAIMIIFKDSQAAVKSIGTATNGVIYTRTGRRFFDQDTENNVVQIIVDELREKDYFEHYETDYVCLDTEIMPWNLKAKDLIRKQYAHVSENALLDRSKLIERLQQSEFTDVRDWLSIYDMKLQNAHVFKEVFQNYCWNVEGIEKIQIAPFHVLAHSNQTFFDKPHLWHMEMNRKLSAGSTLFVETDYKIISNPSDDLEIIKWWEEMTKEGHEGIVIKPEIYISTYKGRLLQPAIKVRGRKYLSIIYGMDYLEPANLIRLKKRNTNKKQKNALKEFALGIEGIKRFVERDSIERIHECVLGVLALESEPVDPRL